MEWGKFLVKLRPDNINKSIDICKVTMQWPPSICEFLDVYDTTIGVPSCEEAFRLACNRDFERPLVKEVYDLCGGDWNFRNDSEKELRRKFKDNYKECVFEMRKSLLEKK